MKEGSVVQLYSSDYNQLQVTNPGLSVIEETAQINMRCIFFTSCLQMETHLHYVLN